MASAENNNEDWREMRFRVDSIANALSIVAGGALSLSITFVLGNKSGPLITQKVMSLTVQAWFCLLGAVVLFLLLKTRLVLQASLLQFQSEFGNRHVKALNVFGWDLAAVGLVTFSWVLFAKVRSAVLAIHT